MFGLNIVIIKNFKVTLLCFGAFMYSLALAVAEFMFWGPANSEKLAS